MKHLISAVILTSTLILGGCETVYEEPKESQPHAKLKLNKSKVTLKEDTSSDTYDEIIIAQSFLAQSGANCEKPAFLGFNKISGYKDNANVEIDRPLSIFVINGYGYGRKTVKFTYLDSDFKHHYQCAMRARFTPEAGKTYIVSARDGKNQTCNMDVTDVDTGVSVADLEVVSGTNVDEITDCSR